METQKNYAKYEEIIAYLQNSGAPKNILEGVKKINEQSINDPLTGLSNRGYLETRLKEEVANSERYGTHLSVIILDTDYFKNINDTYGHQAGDDVLKSLSNYFKGVTRKRLIRYGDIIGRYGGEEFLILLPHTKKEKAYLIAERIRKDIENQKIKIKDNEDKEKNIKVTLSIGISELSDLIDKTEPTELIKRADKALYQAKEEGRNRTKIYSM